MAKARSPVTFLNTPEVSGDSWGSSWGTSWLLTWTVVTVSSITVEKLRLPPRKYRKA